MHIIMDYHFKGEQAEMEQEMPELKEKAKKLLGYELYYQFGIPEGDEELEVGSPLYMKLLKIREQKNEEFTKELNYY